MCKLHPDHPQAGERHIHLDPERLSVEVKIKVNRENT